MNAPRGLLVVIAGPSGVGKGTLLRCLRDRMPEVQVSVSATTRRPRPGEVEGRHYHFLTPDEFRRRIAAGDFLEWAEYQGNYYGTPRSEVDQRIAAGAVVVLEIEVQGARQIRDLVPDALLVFLAPPSLEELERRLADRGTEDVDAVVRRLGTARQELTERDWFDVVVVNDDVERACDELEAAIRAARERV